MTRYRSEALIWVLLLLVALASAKSVSAQGSQASGALDVKSSPSSAVEVPVQISPGDLLDISVYDAADLNQEVRVEADGSVRLALIGSTKVAGLTAQQAGKLIENELKARKFLLNPQVNVLVKEFESQGVSITGEVQHPGMYPVLGQRTLLDVISMAGGLTNVADSKVTIKRRAGQEETVKLRHSDAQTSLANNIQVYPGDLIVVPRAGVVYVLGDVGRPGGYVMEDDGRITLLQALAEAGGVNRTAAVNQAFLLRKGADGYDTDKVHVGKLVRGEGEDIELHPNDIVFLPGSRWKYFVQDTQGVVASAAGATVYAAAVH